MVILAQESASQSNLPVEVQAKILDSRIVDAARAERMTEALGIIDQYRALEGKGITMPPAILFFESVAAEKAADPVRAFKAIEQYLKAAPVSDQNYQEAIRRYTALQSDSVVAAYVKEAEAQAAKSAEEQARAMALSRAKALEEELFTQKCQKLETEYRNAGAKRRLELFPEYVGSALHGTGCIGRGYPGSTR